MIRTLTNTHRLGHQPGRARVDGAVRSGLAGSSRLVISAAAPAPIGPLRGPTWHARPTPPAHPRFPHLTAFSPSRRCGPSAPPGTSHRGRRNQTSRTPHRGRRVPTRRPSSFFRPVPQPPAQRIQHSEQDNTMTTIDFDRPTIHHRPQGPCRAVRRRQRHAHPAVLLGSRGRHRPRQGDLRQVRAACRMPRGRARTRGTLGCVGWRADRHWPHRRPQATMRSTTEAAATRARHRRDGRRRLTPTRRPTSSMATCSEPTQSDSSSNPRSSYHRRGAGVVVSLTPWLGGPGSPCSCCARPSSAVWSAAGR